MSSRQEHGDTAPFLETPPPSPWRLRAEEISRRPRRIKQIACIAACLALVIPLSLLHIAHKGYSPQLAPNLHTPSVLSAPSLSQASGHSIHESNHVAVAPPDPVTFALIMFSADSASEGAVLMKSILMYTSTPIHFHIVCDESAQIYLEKRLALVVRPRHNVAVRFYQLSEASMRGRLEREGTITTDHAAGMPGLMKLFIHELLPETVKKVIFVDTDAFFISDPALLWNQFSEWKSDTAISVPSHPDQSSEEWHNANRICSCIMLLDLEKLRALRLMDSSVYRSHSDVKPAALSPLAFKSMFGQLGPNGHYEGVKLGDQGYWWAIISHRPDIFEPLSFDWEISSCLVDTYLTGLGDDDRPEDVELSLQIHLQDTPQAGKVVLPKILHFNCLDGATKYYEWSGWLDLNDGLAQRWGAAVAYHVGFKWLWLNQGIDNAKVSMETVKNATFADERFNADHQ